VPSFFVVAQFPQLSFKFKSHNFHGSSCRFHAATKNTYVDLEGGGGRGEGTGMWFLYGWGWRGRGREGGGRYRVGRGGELFSSRVSVVTDYSRAGINMFSALLLFLLSSALSGSASECAVLSKSESEGPVLSKSGSEGPVLRRSGSARSLPGSAPRSPVFSISCLR
jgi:hypothetical protein